MSSSARLTAKATTTSDPRAEQYRDGQAALQRVAADLTAARFAACPILERIHRLASMGEKLDHFFSTDMAALMEAAAEPWVGRLRRAAYHLMRSARASWHAELRPELARAGIHVRRYAQLNTG